MQDVPAQQGSQPGPDGPGPAGTVGAAMGQARTPAAARRRLALMVKVAASAGDFSPKLSDAVARCTDDEVQVLGDLLDRGMSIPALVGVLQGAHVIVGDDELYERWIFPTSRRRMSSHHRSVDKARTPDYGLDGPLVRESLHGKAEVGTWVQLERTKATFQWGKLPTWSDVVHIRDYILYRITGKNVGPWGLSAHVDTRPMLLRPPNATASRAAGRALEEFSRRRAHVVDPARATSHIDLLTPEVAPVGPAGDLFAPPVAAAPTDLLPDAPYSGELGEGLFGALSMVRATAPLREGVIALLEGSPPPAAIEPPHGPPESVQITIGSTTLRVQGHIWAPTSARPMFIGIDEEQP
jgi:hypothetical protein